MFKWEIKLIIIVLAVILLLWLINKYTEVKEPCAGLTGTKLIECKDWPNDIRREQEQDQYR